MWYAYWCSHFSTSHPCRKPPRTSYTSASAPHFLLSCRGLPHRAFRLLAFSFPSNPATSSFNPWGSPQNTTHTLKPPPHCDSVAWDRGFTGDALVARAPRACVCVRTYVAAHVPHRCTRCCIATLSASGLGSLIHTSHTSHPMHAWPA